jgi:hypothetical protein
MNDISMVLSVLVLMLPVVAASAWWVKRRYTASVVRLQNEARILGASQENATTTLSSEAIPSNRAPPSLRLNILPADDVRYRVNSAVDSQRLRRRVLSLQFASALTYWCALLLLLAVHALFMVSGDLAATFTLFWFFGPALLPLLLVPPGIAWVLQAGVRRTLVNVAALAILLTGLMQLLSESHWDSANGLGFAYGYASIALVVSAFLRPSVRGAGLPLVIASGAGVIALSTVFALVLAFDDSPDDVAVSAADSAAGAVALLGVLGGAFWCGWRVLKQLSVWYAEKRFSDLQLALATYWGLMTLFILRVGGV